MWFKKKEVSNGITLKEWIKDHIEDRTYLKLYTGKRGTYKILDTSYSTKAVPYGIIEEYGDKPVSIVNILDRANKPDETLVFIEE